MRRSSGIRKYKKRRNQPYPKKAKTTIHVESTTNKSDLTADRIAAPTSDVEDTEKDMNNNAICETPSKCSRSASLLSVPDDSNICVRSVSKTNCAFESYKFDTPRKCTEDSISHEVTIDNPAYVFNPNTDDDDSSQDNDSSRTDCRNPVISEKSQNHVQCSKFVNQKSLLSKGNIIKRIPKSYSKYKHNSENVSSNVTDTNIRDTNAIDCEASYNNALSSPGNSAFLMNDSICTNNLIMNDDISSDDGNSSPNCNTTVTNNIECLDDSSQRTDVHVLESNNGTCHRINLSASYSTRRRYVRHLKHYILSLGSLDIQAAVLLDLLNDSDMKEVIDAAGVKSPKESNFNDHVVSQVLKQINRSSSKSSIRGRVNDDKQSFKINLTAAMIRSPNSIVNHSVSNKKIINMLYNKTSLSRSSARRLVIKANQRRIKLTNGEKDTTWSIISHRTKYNTHQNSMSKAIFEWVLNHPHVISSPIHKDTVIVKVPTSNGQVLKERVGKLLLEISIRELHQDLLKPPPVGLTEVYCKLTKKCLISESYLRNIIPPQLRPITFSQKQLCGCETCTVMKLIHTSLVKFRKKLIQLNNPQSRTVTRSSLSSADSFAKYCNYLNDNVLLVSNDISPIISSMTCPTLDDSGLFKWNCVMNRCNLCPDHRPPTLESAPDSSLDNINYCTYKIQSKCKLHGILSPNTSFCQKCNDAISSDDMNVPDKIVKRKEITSIDSTIDKFHTEVYIPMLKKYRYHMALVTILSKNHCKKSRYNSFCRNRNWFFSERDYAERLVKQLDGEIQSDHFGDNPTLSIEGCTLQYHEDTNASLDEDDQSKLSFDFHSHFSDYSKQDAATTFEHICAMFKVHEQVHGPINQNSVFLDHTDGCAKQYRSGNALYLLNVIALKYHIVIDRAIGAPGHGKSIIDGLNAVDKHFLKKVMCMSGSNRADDLTTRMKMYATVKKSSFSFAKECARLCGQEERKFGVLSTPAYQSRNHKLNERYYHVQDPNNVRYSKLSKKAVGWINIKGQNGDGIRHHYNLRADPALGIDYVAVRRIPCMCDACEKQLKQPWILNKPFYEQPRYIGNNVDCSLWKVLGPLNNWRQVHIVDNHMSSGNVASAVTREIFQETLERRAFAMMSVIKEGNYGAIATTDPSARSGYYVFTFSSTGYVLQNGITINSERIPAGSLVCDITWLNAVPNCSRLYSHGYKDDSSLVSIIRIQHIVECDVKYKPVSSRDMLTKSLRPMYKTLLSKNTIIIDDECHDRIIENIAAMGHLDYEEYFSSNDEDRSSFNSSDEEEYI